MADIDWQAEMEAEARREASRRAALFENVVDDMIELRDMLREAGRHECADGVMRALMEMAEAREALRWRDTRSSSTRGDTTAGCSSAWTARRPSWNSPIGSPSSATVARGPSS